MRGGSGVAAHWPERAGGGGNAFTFVSVVLSNLLRRLQLRRTAARLGVHTERFCKVINPKYVCAINTDHKLANSYLSNKWLGLSKWAALSEFFIYYMKNDEGGGYFIYYIQNSA